MFLGGKWGRMGLRCEGRGEYQWGSGGIWGDLEEEEEEEEEEEDEEKDEEEEEKDEEEDKIELNCSIKTKTN